jgi:hypothetical protein
VDGQKIIEMGQRRNGGVPQKESAVRPRGYMWDRGRKEAAHLCLLLAEIYKKRTKQAALFLTFDLPPRLSYFPGNGISRKSGNRSVISRECPRSRETGFTS